jgi:lipoprotein-releasing system ATP-binding protein
MNGEETTGGSGLSVREVSKSFLLGEETVRVLDRANLEMAGGEAVAIVGPSGSGKSTLLHLIGTLDRPDSGSIEIDGRDPLALPEPELARFRNRSIGFVFQDHHLLPQYSVLENVLLPTLAFRHDSRAARERAGELLRGVGLEHRLGHRPAQLSGGERQRVAVARALINRPSLLLCDEPTGSLDTKTAEAVSDLLLELHRSEAAMLIVVTHSPDLAGRFERRYALEDGRCGAA